MSEPVVYNVQTMPNAKHYHKGKLKFDYLTEDQLRSLQTATVVGTVNLYRPKVSDKNSRFLLKIPYELSERDSFWFDGMYQSVADDCDTKTSVLGYVKVDNGLYVKIIAKRSWLFPLLIVLLGLLLVSGVSYVVMTHRNPSNDSLTTATTVDWDGELPQNTDGSTGEASVESIAIPGYAAITVSSDSPTVQLINPDGNTVNMVYTISYNNDIIYETDGAVPAGKAVEADFYQLFDGKAGSYDLTFQISTYDITTNQPCNGATQAVTLTIQ